MGARGGSGARSAGRGRGFPAWLAIFSLVLQLVVTAGHFHPEDFALFYRDTGGAPVLASMGGQGGAALPGGGGQPALPAHDDCALCFSLQLAGNSAMPEPVVLAAPPDEGSPLPSITAAPQRRPAPHSLAETRAPPIA